MINQPYTSEIYQFQAIDELCAKERRWTVCEREREREAVDGVQWRFTVAATFEIWGGWSVCNCV